MMASCLSPCVPTALTSFLSTILPPGFAVGPSISCKGRLGLWWVGRVLQVGDLLGREEDPEWIHKFQTGRLAPQDLITRMESITDSTKEERAPTQIAEDNAFPVCDAVWISFACQVESKASQNVAVQCTCAEMCVGMCVSMRLRVCHEIQPGTELLLGGEIEGRNDARDRFDAQNISEGEQRDYPVEQFVDPEMAVPNSQTTQEKQINDRRDEEEEENKEPYQLSPGPKEGRLEGSSTAFTTTAKGANSVMTKLNSTDRQRTLGGPAPPVRCSSRLATKPQQVHCQTSQGKKLTSQTHPDRHIDRQESFTVVTKSSAEAAVSMATSHSDAVPVRAANATVEASTWFPEVKKKRYRYFSCGKKFDQIAHLRKHQFSRTKKECGKKCTSAETSKAHQLSHHRECLFSCPHCDKTFGLKQDLHEHLVIHTEGKPYVCECCSKAFGHRSSLRNHRLLHCRLIYPQPSKLQCTICPKLLANSGSLRNHMKLHTEEKPHICQYCGKCFNQKGNLDSHLRIHNGERPYPCPECDQRFAQKPELRRHSLSHTGGYTMATKLRRHIKSSHVTEKPHSCHCGASYTLRQSLLRHQAQHHSQEELKAGLRQKAKPTIHQVNSCHSRPVKGRPKKGSKDEKVQRRGQGKGEESGSGTILRTSETSTATREDENPSNDTQRTVVFVHTDATATPGCSPLLLTSDDLLSRTGQELVEVVLSGDADECIVVQEQQAVGDLMIVQEELCSVAQTVEINTVLL
ncbi:zinc finger protein 408 isoform X2 [Syngnathus scovelli]|uniref:zinc finger protein 408 isoform X2 n=1 Tax=Syngnathus scovelli TaxID=161590 RepID=UPI002110586B|nr:zinc finger protein 408 isoform X2 [Syngnathus scovelli]